MQDINRFFLSFFLCCLTLGVASVSSVYAGGYPHYLQSGLECGNCHNVHSGLPNLIWEQAAQQNIDHTPPNQLCWSCHNDSDAKAVLTHSSLQGSNKYGNWTVECVVCHDTHFQRQAISYSDDPMAQGVVAAVDATMLRKSGPADWVPDAYQGMIVVPNSDVLYISYRIVGNTADTLTVDPDVSTPQVDGSMDLTRVSVGDSFLISFGRLIRNQIDLGRIMEYSSTTLPLPAPTYPKSGVRAVKTVRPQGVNSFADGDATYNGICEVCHTQTTYHRNNSANGDEDHVHGPNSSNCMTCHDHAAGFMHGGGSGAGCESCHGHDAGYEYAPGEFSQGAGTAQSHSTHTENDADDLKGPHIGCGDCHNTASYPYFKSGTDGNGDGLFSLSETDVCNNCHSPGGTFDGVSTSGSSIGAKDNWSAGVYAGTVLATGNEKWCVGCHDDQEANSMADATGVSAPNIAGDGSTYGFYTTGHKMNCLSCHDTLLAHIDHNARTYEFDEAANSVVHPYSNSYRLGAVKGRQPMTVPTPNDNDLAIVQQYYALCLSCHISSEILGTGEYDLASTNFWNDDNNDQGRTYGDGNVRNSHWYHVIKLAFRYDSDFDGNHGNESMNGCVTCHNVHGSPTQAMIRHGELISSPGTTNRVPALDFAYLNGAYTPDSTTVLQDSTGGRMRYLSSVVCFMCHGDIAYYRSPNLKPRVINPAANPEEVVIEGAARNVLLTSTVLDHDHNLSTVTVDLSAIEGDPAQPMYDDGTNGDISAGDNIYSFQTIAPVGTGSAEKNLVVTATDLDAQTDQGTIILKVLELNAGVIVWDAAVPHELSFEHELYIIGSLIIGNGETLSTRGDLSVGGNLIVQAGGTLIALGDATEINQVAGGTENNPFGSGPTISAANITVEATGTINADGTGFGNQEGPGYGSHISYNGSGAGYGGEGGDSMSVARGTTYGNPGKPTALGSGGGDENNGGSGGGALKLVASGAITVDGTLSADGDDGFTGGGRDGGGGSGGSIWIAAGTLNGSGVIGARGGNGGTEGGSGGGGRIDVSGTTYNFSGTITAAGGETAFNPGIPGTILFHDGFWNDLTLNHNITLGNDVTVTGFLSLNNAVLTTSGNLTTVTTLTVDTGGELILIGDTHDINGGAADNPYGSGPTVTATDITIVSGGSLNTDCTGFYAGDGPGKGIAVFYNGSGGGYGGDGGNSTSADGGISYGSSSEPALLGSGGGDFKNGGRGGGAIKLVVGNAITLNGTLSSNGCTGFTGGGRDGGGGSGGSVWIAAGTLNGSGILSARGGNAGTEGGGGGGGRIDISSTVYNFSGTVTADGGETAFDHGMPGTILFPGGFWNDLTLTHDITLGNDVIVTGFLSVNNATLTTSGNITVGTTLTIESGGVLVLTGDTHDINGGAADDPYGSGPTVTATDITIESGGLMSADSQGFHGSMGPGYGIQAAGAGYGGTGGDSSGSTGGLQYGSSADPSALGSGGGAWSALYYRGGIGGGAITLVPAAVLTVDGTLSADGSDGIPGGGSAGGGGSGGSIWIDSGTLAGSGTISATGGNGDVGMQAGGGGGGRIDVSGTVNTFTGSVTADAGTGYQNGQVGTIVW